MVRAAFFSTAPAKLGVAPQAARSEHEARAGERKEKVRGPAASAAACLHLDDALYWLLLQVHAEGSSFARHFKALLHLKGEGEASLHLEG